MPPGKAKTENKVPDYIGHRKRMRDRFRRNGFNGMLKHEVLESLLMLLIPRKDVKPLANKLLRRYDTVLDVISAPPEELMEFSGLGETSVTGLKMIFGCMQHCLQEKCRELDWMGNTEDVCNFVRMKLGVLHRESCMAIFLNSRNKLINYKIYEGTVDHVHTYPRNLAEDVINCHASKLILVHNHPSGDFTPTMDDLASTCAIHDALKAVSAQLVDHIIVTKYGYFSFVANQIPLNRKIEGLDQ